MLIYGQVYHGDYLCCDLQQELAQVFCLLLEDPDEAKHDKVQDQVQQEHCVYYQGVHYPLLGECEELRLCHDQEQPDKLGDGYDVEGDDGDPIIS